MPLSVHRFCVGQKNPSGLLDWDGLRPAPDFFLTDFWQASIKQHVKFRTVTPLYSFR